MAVTLDNKLMPSCLSPRRHSSPWLSLILFISIVTIGHLSFSHTFHLATANAIKHHGSLSSKHQNAASPRINRLSRADIIHKNENHHKWDLAPIESWVSPERETTQKIKRRIKPRRRVRNADGEEKYVLDKAEMEETKGVKSFGGFRLVNKKRVQRESMETEPGQVRKKGRKGHKDIEDNPNAESSVYVIIDLHCGLGYQWDANEKVCVAKVEA